MNIKISFTVLLSLLVLNCKNNSQKTSKEISTVNIAGAMANVMRKGDLSNNIFLDTITNKKGLYGLGPEDHLKGELLINDGKAYISKVTSDTTMQVIESFDVKAPFFVYANNTSWDEIEIPYNVKTINELEQFITEKVAAHKTPLVFKVLGEITEATIHIQNLPEGSKVSSPKDAHQGQTNYNIYNEDVEVIGFFSTKHQAVFTHHDSFVHMHLITEDKSKMGHLDHITIGKMKLLLPKNN